jgi:uncharacterized membrane protein YcaP (DUF421 family)
MMNPVIRGVLIYVFLVVIFRFIGKRSLSQSTTFDLVLLLIISEVTQQGLIGEDNSIIGSFILITTLIGLDLLLSKIKNSFSLFDKIAESMPMIIVDHGKPLENRMAKSRVKKDDIMEAARAKHGLERMDQIKYAVVEKNGDISIIPFDK